MYEDSEHAIAEAETLIAAGEFSRALDKLELAAEALRNAEDAGPLHAEIRELLDAVMAQDPTSHEPQVWAIRALLPRRAGDPTADADEPWFYAYSQGISDIAIYASVLCAIGGIVVGILASRYTTAYGDTSHHAGVIIASTLGGFLGAVLWLAVAAGLRVIVDSGRMLRKLTARAESSPGDD